MKFLKRNAPSFDGVMGIKQDVNGPAADFKINNDDFVVTTPNQMHDEPRAAGSVADKSGAKITLRWIKLSEHNRNVASKRYFSNNDDLKGKISPNVFWVEQFPDHPNFVKDAEQLGGVERAFHYAFQEVGFGAIPKLNSVPRDRKLYAFHELDAEIRLVAKILSFRLSIACHGDVPEKVIAFLRSMSR